MSLPIIRKAFELRLALMGSDVDTVYENMKYSTKASTPFQTVALIPADPDDSFIGARTYFERGIFQVKVHYPAGAGPADATARAYAIRQQFKRGTLMTQDGVNVLVTATPTLGPAMEEGDRYVIPVSIRFQAQIST